MHSVDVVRDDEPAYVVTCFLAMLLQRLQHGATNARCLAAAHSDPRRRFAGTFFFLVGSGDLP
jgi:hypothetical protein